MPRTAGLHPHPEGLNKVTGAEVTQAARCGRSRCVTRPVSMDFACAVNRTGWFCQKSVIR
jgi:hypothetical protein